MFIDKILSRFKIKTKVLLFVLPFVISISAVGLTGLYASGLLQGRMEISNSVLQSLTGFKNLYGSMDDFLRITNEQQRDKLYDDIKSQQGVLASTLDQLGKDADGRDNLTDATTKTAAMANEVAKLWTLHEQEVDFRKAIDDAQKALIKARFNVDFNGQQLEDQMRQDQAAATSTLRSADRLLKGGDQLVAVAEDFNKAATPVDKVKLLKDRLPDLNKAQRSINLALPQNQKSVVQSLVGTIKDLTAFTESTDVPTDDTIAGITRLLSRFRQTSTYTQLAATQMMRQATTTFVDMDAKVVQTNSVLQDTRRLQGSIYSLQLVLGEFLANTSKDNLTRLRQEVFKLRGAMDTMKQSAKGMDFIDGIDAAIRPALKAIEDGGDQLVNTSTQRVAEYAAARQQLDQVWGQLTAFAETQKQSAGTEREQANYISILATILGIILSVAGGIALVLTLQRPIGQITAAMRRIADGMLETTISGEKRHDEIGDMARALGIFKENAISKIRIEEQSDEERAAAEHERQRNDAEKRELDRQIDFAVSELAAGLERLAQGDISSTIEKPFIGRLEQLRQDFNSSLSRLQQTISQVRDNVEMIQSNGNQMAASAEDLSKRTEQQAASLEQTAAAVDEITVTVRSSAERAKDADAIVREAKRSADDSSVVVGNAIDAMTRIEDASRKIEQIIGVIDEIAFQTNLLALNAGIEAARAGDAGKGFAVVAMEVRELAQRSAAAAKEIKGLINKSTQEVNSGSQFVQQAGSVLAQISGQIVTISQHVEMIARASHDQASALQEVNASVNHMDQMTQKNAGMVEETTAASRELASEADALLYLIQQFKIESGQVVHSYQRADAA
ncbi:HAMP domain-containing protein [Agrobacterium rhizogenes]|uniref:Methyl-accepting chemotaxis protein n=1 Tax=Rhizobium rhizogenes (strain K84 / ATCC BAA-868) TaxID=311403 RepID=B9J9C1_RHIR8|nr:MULTISPECIES: HAMP domain-containing methyl-accepting chemotaxis protein [Rhizobium]ACM25523.1 methyl-accepting chemotaxis protein [Rhizobium rhizogenes K84]KAA6483613.1 methyl-accepting chemotaxis protein [Agrobacterium sp. ICMP 7243]OCJ26697.1 chemotaxis protein [Agrobacterium sp. B133/95]EJK80162.1 methyl-accepting chemotaxis protein [Rhizobium sp. AP16]MDJ1638431.1 HAMP domain-containing methyl-accepting chemotaxis protein [Rhizobium rhizogenes]